MLLTNLTIARFQRKYENFGSLARNQLHIFSGTYCKKKKGGKSHTINYYGKSGDSRTPDPRQGLYKRNCNGRNYTSYHSWRCILKALICWKLESFRGLCPPRPPAGALPLHPARGPTAGPWTPPVWGAALRAHTVRYAHGFFRPPLFLQILDPPLYTSPLLVQVACPQRRRSWGSWGAVAPPPPMKFFFWGGGGQTYRFAPPPPQ